MNNDKPRCLLDLDGVLSDFMLGAHKHADVPYSHEEYPYPKGKYVEMFAGNLKNNWINFNATFWANLPWTKDGNHILTIVEKIFDPENVCILTKPSGSPQEVHGKAMWIKKNLPDYVSRSLLGGPKSFAAGPVTVLIDDNEDNVREFEEAGGEAILVPRLWNCLHESSDEVIPVLKKALYQTMEKFKYNKGATSTLYGRNKDE